MEWSPLTPVSLFTPTVPVPQIFSRVDPTTIYPICLSHKIPQSKLVPQFLHREPSFMTLHTTGNQFLQIESPHNGRMLVWVAGKH